MKKCISALLFVMALVLCAAAAAPLQPTGGAMAKEPQVILQGDTPSESGVHGKGNVYAPETADEDSVKIMVIE